MAKKKLNFRQYLDGKQEIIPAKEQYLGKRER